MRTVAAGRVSQLRTEYETKGYASRRPSKTDYLSLVDQARELAYEMLGSPPPLERKWTHSSGNVKHLVNPHRVEHIFQRLMECPEIGDIIAELFGDTAVYVTHSKISYKCESIDQVWLPHQDSGYSRRPAKGATLGIHLERCSTANGALEVYPGSHHLGGLKHEIVYVTGENEPQVRVANLPSIEPVPVDGEAGTVLCFSTNMIHASGINTSGGARPILIFQIEPVAGDRLPLETDGSDAIILNAGLREFDSPTWLPVARAYRRATEFLLLPVAKRVLHVIHRLTGRFRVVDPSEGRNARVGDV